MGNPANKTFPRLIFDFGIHDIGPEQSVSAEFQAIAPKPRILTIEWAADGSQTVFELILPAEVAELRGENEQMAAELLQATKSIHTARRAEVLLRDELQELRSTLDNCYTPEQHKAEEAELRAENERLHSRIDAMVDTCDRCEALPAGACGPIRAITEESIRHPESEACERTAREEGTP